MRSERPRALHSAEQATAALLVLSQPRLPRLWCLSSTVCGSTVRSSSTHTHPPVCPVFPDYTAHLSPPLWKPQRCDLPGGGASAVSQINFNSRLCECEASHVLLPGGQSPCVTGAHESQPGVQGGGRGGIPASSPHDMSLTYPGDAEPKQCLTLY